MKITLAHIQDAPQILALQKLAYQSEADIYQDQMIPPLTETLEQIKNDFSLQVFFKILDGLDIIGSVRARTDHHSCFIGRLIVNPAMQGRGMGTQLMNTVEAYFKNVPRYELFTGKKSAGNLRFYDKLGYKPFREQPVTENLTLVFMEKLTGNVP
jgi:GNAT superfamily N-acetyltransferase